MKILKPASYGLILSLGLMLTFTSCEKDPKAMELPPAESLVIDWDAFPNNAKKSAELIAGNWFYSAGTIVVWNVVVGANILVPTTAYAAAFNTAPVYLGDNSWEWSYTVKVGQFTYAANLVGARIDNESFSMSMTLSQVGGFQDFQWFTGIIRYDGTSAVWTLSYNPDNAAEYLEIDYSKDFETDVANIRYTVIDPQNELYQGYIDYGIDPELDYDAHYTIFKENNTTYIEWNTSTNAGHVKDQIHFGDANWHCWDSQLQDVDCNVE